MQKAAIQLADQTARKQLADWQNLVARQMDGFATDAEADAHDRVMIAFSEDIWKNPPRSVPDLALRSTLAMFWNWPEFDDDAQADYQRLLSGTGSLDRRSVAELCAVIMELDRAAVQNAQ